MAQAFRDKRIRSPVHFPGGNESQVIEAFRDFRPGVDWLCSNWRNMYHCLLAGMPEEELFDAILAGRSMYIMSKKHRIICSSIVGGMLPTACGLAMGIKRRTDWADTLEIGGILRPVVWVCVGDMCESTGLFHEFVQYCDGFDLPIRIVVENNGLSTNAPTKDTWGGDMILHQSKRIIRYEYRRTLPHVGLAERVAF